MIIKYLYCQTGISDFEENQGAAFTITEEAEAIYEGFIFGEE